MVNNKLKDGFLANLRFPLWSKILIFWPNSNIWKFFKKKFFDQKIKILTHSENLKSAKSATVGQKYPKIVRKISSKYFDQSCTLKSSKNLHYGPISQ